MEVKEALPYNSVLIISIFGGVMACNNFNCNAMAFFDISMQSTCDLYIFVSRN